ncbi:Uncharacterised protein [Comamonas aquatica]|uniref:helix-turn-helix domain-containing protein n=1 Tax=Comamonas aquatica TaxID=225991 RepID=UPI001EF24113|nr:helix-turn-helix domain-containing protein [Comamonas aquatica]CAB5687003.1 Uncharacterised protein [Comamonas aquatica]CAC9212067.1 Uncharacterised protein [Comamonas aquatica]
MNPHATQVIDVLGGTAEVARLFDVRMPSVSDWKRDGIPHARMMLLRETRKEQLGDIDLAAATAARRGRRAKPSQEPTHA